MNAVAALLVVSSAGLHATWNLLAKRSRDALAFLFLVNVATLAIYALPFVLFVGVHPILAGGWPFVAATSALHVWYYRCLAAAYTHGALSLAYPVSRGTGVALVPLLALPLLGERITRAGGLGMALVLAGIVTVHRAPLRSLVGQPRGIVAGGRGAEGALGTLFALLTGAAICGYSLVDKAGVARVHPVAYGYLLIAGSTLGLAPCVLGRRRGALRLTWAEHRGAVMAGGVLVLGTYLIVLGAMRLAPLSYIVPLREVSVVIGAALGVWLLGEGTGRERIAGAALILAGALAIATLG
ncbi:MAG: EamA family transporter [Sphaerobacter sp.]|nr:EamA family transporter [Sphaerobacter sp.]